MTKPDSTIAEWEKEFYYGMTRFSPVGWLTKDGFVDRNKLEAFITQLLHRQREELLDELWMTKMARIDAPRSFGDGAVVNVASGYNDAVQQLQDKITALRSSEEMK